jgi:hypothetical protein
MTFNSVRYFFSALILVTGLLTASLSFASSVTGDNFTVEVSEELVPLAGSESGVAGSAGGDVGVYPGNAQFEVDWIDGDTFKIDWFSGEGSDLQNLTITLKDLDFVHNGNPVDITGVTPLPLSQFDWPKDVSFTANSITIVYPNLSNFEAGDGSIPSFDVITDVSPVFLSYIAVTPCRIVDTRKTSAGIIGASGQRNFRVFGSGGNISAQGGNPAGCSSPAGEPLAAHINMVAVNPTGKGNLQAFPVGGGPGAGLSVNYNTIDTNLANAGTVKTVTGGGADITVASNFSSSHAVIDVLGYYYPSP